MLHYYEADYEYFINHTLIKSYIYFYRNRESDLTGRIIDSGLTETRG